MRKKRITMMCIAITAAVALGGCADRAVEAIAEATPEPTATALPTPTPVPTPMPVPTPDITGMAISVLTGEYIDEEVAARRPVAIVINNMRKAIPQSGLSQAAILYEVLAEGDITRLVGIFQDFDSEKIGPVRSTRPYFSDFAMEYDAIFVHHGGSNDGYAAVKKHKLDNLDGQFDSLAYWRDPVRFNTPGMYEHSSYTNAEKILTEAERQKMRMELYEDSQIGFSFYPIEALPMDSEPAVKITVPFSANYTSVFEYDSSTKKYKKFQNQTPHIDEETGEQLEVSNVLVQFVEMRVVDDVGRRDVKLIGSGNGMLFTGGEFVPVTWEKTGQKSPTQWFDAAGKTLKLNTGKTWICVYKGEIKYE